MEDILPEKVIVEEEVKKRSPLWYIVAAFLVLMVVVWIVPYYGLRSDPKPSNIPPLDSVLADAPQGNYSFRLQSISDVRSLQVSPFMKHVSGKVASSCSEVSDVCYSKAFFYFVRDNIVYVPDPKIDYVESPEAVLLAGSSDCDGQAVLLAMLLKSVGITSRIALTYDHSYVQVYLPGAISSYKSEDDWVFVDPTCKNCRFGQVTFSSVKDVQEYVYV
ncbi:MAG: transglutaminase-like domain-containing protein [Candidatus Nanoarchaeia archaeon]